MPIGRHMPFLSAPLPLVLAGILRGPTMQTKTMIGIIGGSGLYEIDGLEGASWVKVKTPWGAPSDEVLVGRLDGIPMAFLPRHGRGHVHSPSDVPYRANINAMKRLGVTDVISVSACGSLREELPPGTFVLADQFIDRTFAREKSFFEPGLVAHVSMAHPVCGRLGEGIAAAAAALKIPHVRGGTYLTMEGPQFSTLAESELYRSWGCDVIGMTNMPEAKLAREAEMCYATIAMVTDYDCWHEDHGAVTVDQIVRVLLANADKARELVKAITPMLQHRVYPCDRGCHHALDSAIITSPDARDQAVVKKLAPIIGRVLPAA